MPDVTEGEQVRARRERGGWDKLEVAEKAGVHRNTLAAIERGESFNATTLAKIKRALDELEREAGIDAPPPEVEPGRPNLIEFEVSGDFGARVVVRGPVEDADALERQVARLIRDIRGKKAETE